MSTDPHVSAAKGMTRHALDWLDGDVAGDSPFAVKDPRSGYTDTDTYWETVHDTGINPVRVWHDFDRTVSRYRSYWAPTFLGSTS